MYSDEFSKVRTASRRLMDIALTAIVFNSHRQVIAIAVTVKCLGEGGSNRNRLNSRSSVSKKITFR